MFDIEPIKIELEKRGYFFSSSFFVDELDDLSEALMAVSRKLGTPNKGRNAKAVEVLTPKNTDEAHQNSLSDQYGKGELPFHVDSSHQQVPSRYLVFACSRADGKVAPTFLLDVSHLELGADDAIALETGVFLVRNGKRSFYANIRRPDAPFMRWDPGCMYPQDSIAESVASKLSHLSHILAVRTINWSTGALLVVDNWRMLHARGKVLSNHGDRALLRTTIQ
jgi:hypothetical protein